MGKYEITQAQWKAVMGEAQLPEANERAPVNDVRWGVAKQFCQKLSRMTGKAYRLPSEAEWEYACRAGTTGDFAGDVNKMAWYERDPRNWDKSKDRYAHPVGMLAPNAFGLYDMHGNVTEWCEDWWHDSYDGAPADGSAWTEGGDSRFRVGRGGFWGNHKGMVTSSYRFLHPLDHFTGYGFRVVVSAGTK
jgi:formylglycine-generating enzyme required for sulfatase activity